MGIGMGMMTMPLVAEELVHFRGALGLVSSLSTGILLDYVAPWLSAFYFTFA